MQPLRLRYWWLSGGVLWVATVLYLTLMPAIGGWGWAVTVNDKFGHFIAFFVLMAWFGGVYARANWRFVAVALAAFGIAIELIQGLLSYRSAEFADMLYDFAGIGAAWICVRLGFGRWALRIESWWFEPPG